MKFIALLILSFLSTLCLCWLAWAIGVPLPWVFAISVAQVGVMWWRLPWAVGSYLGLLLASWLLIAPTIPILWLAISLIGSVLQWYIPTIIFDRYRLAYDVSTNDSLIYGLLVGGGLNTGFSALSFGLIGAWWGYFTNIKPLEIIALIWLAHYLTAVIVAIPLLRYGTHYLPYYGIFASPAAYQRSIYVPKIPFSDILFPISINIAVVLLSLILQQRYNSNVQPLYVLLLLPIAILMYIRGLDGVLLAGPMSVLTILMLVPSDSLTIAVRRANYASTLFELGVYYLVGIVMGMILNSQREEQRRLQAITEINQLFLSHDSVILPKFVQHVCNDLKATACVVMDYNSEQQSLKALAWTLQQPIASRLLQPLNLTKYPDFARVIEQDTAQALHSQNIKTHPSTSLFWLETGYTTALCVPLMGSSAPVGMVMVVDDRPERVFTNDEINLVSAICVYVRAAFEQNRLIHGLQERTNQLYAVSRITATLNASLNDHLAVYQQIAQQIATVVPYDWACLGLSTADEHLFQIVMQTGPTAIQLANDGLRLLDTTLATIHQNEHAPYLMHLDPLPEEHVGELTRAGMRTVLVIPVQRNDRWLGLLVLASKDPSAFPESQQKLLQSLKQHVALAIANAQLYQQLDETYQAKEQAHEALLQTERLRSLGELSSGIAHDFNNLLTGILGHTQLMMIESPTEQQKGLHLIEQAARDGRRMLERILQFGRIQQSTVFELVNLDQIISDTIELARPRWGYRAKDQQINLIHRPNPSVPAIYGSAFALREVLMNLLLNAVDAMPNGGQLRMSTDTVPEGVLLEVQDSGLGMDEITKARMWEPFFSTKGNQGTGLGLSIAHSIVVQQHAGMINVLSELGQGTTIQIIFPCPSVAIKDTPTKSEAISLQQPHILLIEPDQLVCSALEGLLNNAGYTVKSVGSGRDGLLTWVRDRWDIIIIDDTLPDKSAWELVEIFKGSSKPSLTILLSMWDSDPLNQRRQLFDAILPKPFEAEQVIALVHTLIQQRNYEIN